MEMVTCVRKTTLPYPPHIPFHLSIDGQRLALHASHTAQDQNGAIQHSQSALHLHSEIHMTGRIDNVDIVALPHRVGGSRLDRNPALSLQLHRIHGGSHIVLSLDFVHLFDATGVEQDALGQRRLPAVDMRRNTNVPDPLQLRVLGKSRVARERLFSILKRKRNPSESRKRRTPLYNP